MSVFRWLCMLRVDDVIEYFFAKRKIKKAQNC